MKERDDFICDSCKKIVDTVYFYEEKEICEECRRMQKQTGKQDVESQLALENKEGG